jgi:hypothetical protein
MIVPNANLAIVDEARLIGYGLNPAHPRGRHKARAFRSRIGIVGRSNAGILRAGLLAAVKTSIASPGDKDSFGQRYIVDFDLPGPGGRARVRSAWITRSGEDFPRLLSCYVL